MKEVFNISLNITPTTWGSEKDPARREEIRKEIKKKAESIRYENFNYLSLGTSSEYRKNS